MRKSILLLLLGVLALSGCQRTHIYSEFYSMPINGWHQDSILTYTVNLTDSTNNHEVLIIVRHTTQYPYQNLWLFVDEYAGSILINRDTIEAMVADDYGKWLGKGINRYELPLRYAASYRFIQKENNRITIQQGMRTPCLIGITDVGLIIKQNYEQK